MTRIMIETSNKPVNIKYHNQKLVLSIFRQTGSLSIADLSARIDLSKTTVAKILNELERKKLILALGKGPSTDVGGKKPERFAFNPTHSHVIALAVTHDKAIGALSDLRCNLLHQNEVHCPVGDGYGRTVEKLAGLVADLLQRAALEPKNLCSITLACEGVIDTEKNRIRYALYHDWEHNLDICGDLARLLPFPAKIRVDNNVRLAGYAHLILNQDEYGPIVVISSQHFAGGCVIEAKQLVHGANGFVGEFGHMILEPGSDILCHCGCRGCFGSLVSPRAVLAEAEKSIALHPSPALAPALRDGTLSIEDVFAAANRGDALARRLVDRSAGYFAQLVHNITLLRDPVKVVIQGVYSTAGDYFLETLRERVASLPFYRTGRELPILYTPLNVFNAYLVGAVYFAVDEFLDSNQLYD